MRRLFLLALFLFAASVAHAGPIYVYTDQTGAIRFTSKPPPKGVTAKVFTAKKSNYSLMRRGGKQKLFPHKYQNIIKTVSHRYQVSEPLIRAVIHTESAFNPKAVSPKGARGLMQIMPFHDKHLGIKDPFEPSQNIEAGVRLLALLGKRYQNNLSLVLAAYNAGEDAVSKYGGVPPYEETRNYVKRVLRLRNEYRSLSS
ncbi:MAG: lytic transglycosylase domain-containing protein [Bdellovibrionales bacterium]|nr:lytic transglycosylase domain-containing protein [Bdellovibrionales bacterium]